MKRGKFIQWETHKYDSRQMYMTEEESHDEADK